MNFRKEYTTQLVTSLVEEMLPSIAARDEKAIKCFANAHIEISKDPKVPFEFELGNFFDAVVHWGQISGVAEPVSMDHQKYFNEFCIKLMEPWPIEAFEKASLKINLTHRSNTKIRYKYEISFISRVRLD